MRRLLPLTMLLACASTVHAQNETFFIPIEEGHPEFIHIGDVPENHTPWDLIVDVSSSDWFATHIEITLDTGSMFQDTLKRPGQPDLTFDIKPDDFSISLQPTLRWDTWVTAPVPPFTLVAPDGVLDTDGALITWFDVAFGQSGIWQIGRFTFSNDANGTITGTTADANNVGGNSIPFEFLVENGQVVVPEPSTLLLAALGLLGLLGFARRRRR